jgi:hypothetical protein
MGSDPGEQTATALLRDAVSNFENFSVATQNALYPFLLPPLHEQSWFRQRENPQVAQPAAASPSPPTIKLPQSLSWTPDESLKGNSQVSDTGKYKVWWPKDHPEWADRAKKVLAYLDDGDYDAVVSVLGREPLPDGGFQGDDAAIDIFYYEDKASESLLGWTLPYLWGDPAKRCKASPNYIGINGYHKETDAGVDLLEMTVAHEMFHAAQLAYDMYSGCALNVSLK